MVERRRPSPPTRRPALTAAEAKEVGKCLWEIDAARYDMRWHEDNLWALRSRSKRVRQAYRAFQDAGGVDADDWLKFLRGAPLRGCGRQIRHLRVISNNMKRRPAGRTQAAPGPSAA